MAIVVVVATVLGRAWYQTSAGRLSVDRNLLRLPLLGTILVEHHTIQLTRTLATVLAGARPSLKRWKLRVVRCRTASCHAGSSRR